MRKSIKKKMPFSNLVSFARQHLFSYNKLSDLIEKIEKDWRKKQSAKPTLIATLFDG